MVLEYKDAFGLHRGRSEVGDTDVEKATYRCLRVT